MPHQLRRIVTGHNAAGQATVTFDGPVTNVRELPGWPGLFVNELWVTDESPAETSGASDRALRPIRHDPAPRGSIFRVIEIPSEDGLRIDAAQTFRRCAAAISPPQSTKPSIPACIGRTVSTTCWCCRGNAPWCSTPMRWPFAKATASFSAAPATPG